MPYAQVPCPCVVYSRQKSGGQYTFSHHSPSHALKTLPASLRVADIRTHASSSNWGHLQKACFLVLVAGDVAQCVSISNAGDASRVQFLYKGSRFASRALHDLTESEVADSHVTLRFFGTMAVYDPSASLSAIVPLESGIALFPRNIQEGDVPMLAQWASNCMQRSLQASVWVTASGGGYNELTLEPTRNTRIKRRF